MKLCIIGPGIMPIPPAGWGAVEILIWDLRTILVSKGYDVFIINDQDRNQILKKVNEIDPDFIHIMYDEFIDIADCFNCKKVIITSHYGYLEQSNRYDTYYNKIFNGFVTSKVKIFALSEGIKNVYLKAGIDSKRVFVVPNGVRTDLFKFDNECKFKDLSIYIGKIDFRKRQFMFQDIPNLFFVGNNVDPRFKSNNYLGEWNKESLYNNLTDYANLVLLSDGEAHALVCMEAMIAGLGLVISEYATANLDLSMPFIDVIPENMIKNSIYVEKIIWDNRKKSVLMRDKIRKYAINNFSYEKTVDKYYLTAINKI